MNELAVAVDCEIPFEEYVQLLMRNAEIETSSKRKLPQYANVVSSIYAEAQRKLSHQEYDAAFILFHRFCHIIQKTDMIKRKAELQGTSITWDALRPMLKESMNIIEKLRGNELVSLHLSLMKFIHEQRLERERTRQLQLVDNEEEEDSTQLGEGEAEKSTEEAAAHEKRRQELLQRNDFQDLVDPANPITTSSFKGLPPPLDDASLAQQEEFKHSHRLALLKQKEEQSVALLQQSLGLNQPMPQMPTARPVVMQRVPTPPPPPPQQPEAPHEIQPDQKGPQADQKQQPATSLPPPTATQPPLKQPPTTSAPLGPKPQPPWRFPPPGGQRRPQNRRGMVNLGNTCYLNSVVQATMGTFLGTYFLSDEYIDNIVDRYTGGGRVVNSYSFIVREMSFASPYPISPSALKNAVGALNEMFKGKSQQDANEFCRALIDGIHEELNSKRGAKVPPVEIDNAVGSDVDLAVQYWNLYTRCNQSIIVNLFGFQEKSVLRCVSCGLERRSFNPAMSLEVAIPFQARSITIEECLGLYCREEALDLDSLVHCARCKKKTPARKQLQLYSTPEVLVITIKRFKALGNFSDKISTPVIFQSTLDLAPFKANRTVRSAEQQQQQGPKQSSRYRLTAVVNHQGNIHGGHYTADVCGFMDNQWFGFSDEVIKQTEAPNFRLAYMLWYVQEN